MAEKQVFLKIMFEVDSLDFLSMDFVSKKRWIAVEKKLQKLAADEKTADKCILTVCIPYSHSEMYGDNLTAKDILHMILCENIKKGHFAYSSGTNLIEEILTNVESLMEEK